ncbi:MAG: asparaginase domain-containing protein [Caldilinea sp.]
MRIIATGGTFDKYYDELRGELTFKDSHLPAILKQARITAPIVLEINQLIDSLHMQEVNRQHILASCRAAPETQIVVIHGTDTMALTARVLGEAQLAKTIVLTGAMVPYAVQGSDALFNLGFACAAAQLLPHGVYIAMNGQVFAWDRVRKNTQLGIFESIPTD